MKFGGLDKAQLQQYQEQGFLVIPGVFTPADCEAMRREADRLVEAFDPSQHPKTVFSTSKQTQTDYFLNSGDNISYFFEEKAFDDKDQLCVPRSQAFNKIGHALHAYCDVFRRVTHDPCVLDIFRCLGYTAPAVPQSMYIFKQPGIGGEVVPHRDSTFLYTDPVTAVGIWIPIDECTVDNGCLWFIPGSHKDGKLKRRMVRKSNGEGGLEFLGDVEHFDPASYVPVECTRGSLVLIDGMVVHKSAPNMSAVPRNAYTFHVIDSQHPWDAGNWLQPTQKLPFVPLYK